MSTKLTTGETYDVAILDRFECWSTESGDYPGAFVADYFDAEGRYLGPDVDGVEPLFALFAEPR